jgi:tRNA modification GTPase
MVELSCHGGLLVPTQLLAALYDSGARPARPGEFTFRAVLNGKLDLLRAEAVGDLIDATAPHQGKAALHQLEGGLSRRLGALREDLVGLLALLDYEVDFPEEDDGPVPREEILARLDACRADIGGLIATAPAGERLREGALVVIAGPPNAGKSSLFNALLGTDRALVTELPGTTRDTIEAFTALEGWPVRLADTAGLWEAPDRLDRLGVEVSRRYLGAADLLLACVPAGEEPSEEMQRLADRGDAILVRTKSDLDGGEEPPTRGGITVSVVTGRGLDTLRREIVDRIFADSIALDLEPALTRERHRIALERARESLGAAREILESEMGDAVLAAHQVRTGVAALDELVGVVDPDEVLGRIFSQFCVGK